ncbi:ROK family protein [Asticcacaulis excentricus]|uniref:ROK family protein n=1 Tax=Asticcacaulis excentricus (strain ATCC 15261 / DSM 4724 / KCTC 12464 / NCIMB 9791 / VKM B-1370 / CB 48) TaxID=573065 RepID=E8RKM0_ASTEC|nr:ROK family protein [Asticcacaulis excentricus]ADU13554.1 ROK family protein [Asticcacaulis excentricus CB 48]
MLYIGVDFGGTKIEAAALSDSGDVLARSREPNPGDYDAALLLVKNLIARVEAEARQTRPDLAGAPASIGIGSPGSVSPRTGLMRNSNSLYLNGRTFREDLETTLGRPVRLANDANCLALSEAIDGAAAGASSVFAIIVGTGCGGGVVVNGQLVNGANGIAGEWGHMPLPWPKPAEYPGPKCWCGQHGCLETWVSGTGFARDFQQTTGRELKGEEIISAMRNGDAEARAAFEALLSRLGRGMAAIVNILDPDVFVFGGGLSNVPEIYDALPGLIRPYVFSDGWDAKLAPARWGDSSGVRGAAYLWKQG